jgi:hypothetical protein
MKTMRSASVAGLLLGVLGLGACGDDTAGFIVVDGGNTDDTTENDTSSTDTVDNDTVEVDAGDDAVADTVENDATDTSTEDTRWEQSGPDPGPLPDQGPAPSGYGTTAPAGADPDWCVTGEWWLRDDRESYDMNPGEDCVACHEAEREGPFFSFSGTVFGDWDDQDDCRGIEDVTIDILDANGDLVTSMNSRASGNFTSQTSLGRIEMPYTARVRYDGRERWMVTPQTDGNCNSCHGEIPSGDAPGRIILP